MQRVARIRQRQLILVNVSASPLLMSIITLMTLYCQMSPPVLTGVMPLCFCCNLLIYVSSAHSEITYKGHQHATAILRCFANRDNRPTLLVRAFVT